MVRPLFRAMSRTALPLGTSCGNSSKSKNNIHRPSYGALLRNFTSSASWSRFNGINVFILPRPAKQSVKEPIASARFVNLYLNYLLQEELRLVKSYLMLNDLLL